MFILHVWEDGEIARKFSQSVEALSLFVRILQFASLSVKRFIYIYICNKWKHSNADERFFHMVVIHFTDTSTCRHLNTFILSFYALRAPSPNTRLLSAFKGITVENKMFKMGSVSEVHCSGLYFQQRFFLEVGVQHSF